MARVYTSAHFVLPNTQAKSGALPNGSGHFGTVYHCNPL
jgi:hypothetical protein